MGSTTGDDSAGLGVAVSGCPSRPPARSAVASAGGLDINRKIIGTASAATATKIKTNVRVLIVFIDFLPAAHYSILRRFARKLAPPGIEPGFTV